jgi:exodeoxyribonuclease VII small subunit
MERIVPRKPREFDYEGAIRELEQIVERMEKGDMRLEDALHSFERGVQLARGCQKALGEAEQKVRILMEQEGENGSLLPFERD